MAWDAGFKSFEPRYPSAHSAICAWRSSLIRQNPGHVVRSAAVCPTTPDNPGSPASGEARQARDRTRATGPADSKHGCNQLGDAAACAVRRSTVATIFGGGRIASAAAHLLADPLSRGDKLAFHAALVVGWRPPEGPAWWARAPRGFRKPGLAPTSRRLPPRAGGAPHFRAYARSAREAKFFGFAGHILRASFAMDASLS